MASLLQSHSGVLPALEAGPLPQALRYGIWLKGQGANAWLSCWLRPLAWLSLRVDKQNLKPIQRSVSSRTLPFLLGMKAQVSREKTR